MEDLFTKETAVLQRAKQYMSDMPDPTTDYYQEFYNMALEYECLLRQAKLLIRCADLTTTGLNSDKLELLSKVNIDELTGIYNRRYLEDNLSRYLNLLSRADGHLSLLMLDLDFFKNFNDSYGHTAGDYCLKQVAGAIQSSLSRAEDFVARYGGEEFVVVLFGTDREGALPVAQKILEGIQKLRIPHAYNDAADCVTISIGVTSAEVRKNGESNKYIARADAALYHSKRTGRNKITYFQLEGESV